MRLTFSLIIIALLAACAGPKYTVDDGRRVDQALLDNIRSYGLGEKALRPAIVRSAALQDPDCDIQWELPFSVATSYDTNEDDRVAWVRGLGVDERLTVIAASSDSPLQPGDKIKKIGAFTFSIKDTDKMLLLLENLRDAGFPFDIQLSTNKTVKVSPFKVCRGHSRFAPPNNPALQSYHWRQIVQPLEVARAGLSDDEALWVVLWAQGLSEEGGARMKTYHYGLGMVGTLFTLASGFQSSVASEAGAKVAKSAATTLATGALKDQLSGTAPSATRKSTDVKTAMQRAAANRSSLSGIAWAASTAFEEADAWAYARLEKLDADPLAGFELHQKLIDRGSTSNSMVFDLQRLKALNKIAEKEGLGEEVETILHGIKPEALQF